MSTKSFVGALCLVAVCLMCCAIIEPARGLECYKSTWSDPNSMTLNETSTVVCDKPAVFRIKRQDPPQADETTTAAATSVAPPAGSTNGSDFYCFSATVNNDTQSAGVERGCKSSSKDDDCLTLDTVKYPKAKVDKCVTCNTDKCNNGALSAILTFSLHCAIISTAMVVRTLTDIVV